jgi:S-DNA-T family DNA segregation ATPase FtsK/SpoIIIE
MLRRLGRWLRRDGWRVLWWALIGVGFLLRHAARYCIGYHDYAGMVARSREINRPRQEWLWRTRWRRAAARRTVTVVGVLIVLAVAAKTAVDLYGWLVAVGINLAVIAVLAGVGRAVRRPAKEDKPPEDKPGEPPAPFPLADAHTRAEVADCVRRAVEHEGLSVRLVGEAARQPWGWHVPVVLRAGKPADLVAKLGELETSLDLPAGGVLATPDQARRARIMLRLAQRDPIADLASVPARDPLSLSILDSHTVGARMDGKPLKVRLAGANVVVIGDPGAGKSMTLRVLADVVTACRDAIAWDLSPSGTGLDVYGDAIARRERTSAGIEAALAAAIEYATARPHVAVELGMPDEWEPSPDRPAVVVFIDEYPRLSDRAKELAAELVTLGRKARVSLVLAASEATSDTLGRAIADTVPIRIMHACRHADVRLVFGPRMIADGWRPDRLHPATDADNPEDAGCCYINAATIREPILSKIIPLPSGEAHQRGAARAQTGIPCLDRETIDAATHRTSETGSHSGTPVVDSDAITAIIAAFGSEARLWNGEILSSLAKIGARYRGWTATDLAAALRPLGVVAVQIRKGAKNRRGYERAVIENAWRRHTT